MYSISQLNNVPILELLPTFNLQHKPLIDMFGNKPFHFWFEYVNAYEQYKVKSQFRNLKGYQIHFSLLTEIKTLLVNHGIEFEATAYTAKNSHPYERLRIIRTTIHEVETFELKVLENQLHYMKSAKKRNLDFNLTKGDIRKLLTRKTCYYTGEPLTDNNRSVDRLDNRKGYVKGNVVACTVKANQLKEHLFESKQIPTKFLRKILELMDAGILA